MAKKTQKTYRNISVEADDDFDDIFDDEFNWDELSRDIYSTEWSGERDRDISARRKIERRRDMKRLYSQLDDWEEFGRNPDNYIY
jgi:hypothetical protein